MDTGMEKAAEQSPHRETEASGRSAPQSRHGEWAWGVGKSTSRGIGHKSANPFHSFGSHHPLKQAILFHFSQKEMMTRKHQDCQPSISTNSVCRVKDSFFQP